MDNSARPWRGRADARQAAGVEWWVGVLRSGVENIAWTRRGEAADWATARLEVIATLKEIAAVEGRQEYRVQIDGQDGIVTPGLDADGQIALAELDRVLPANRYWA